MLVGVILPFLSVSKRSKRDLNILFVILGVATAFLGTGADFLGLEGYFFLVAGDLPVVRRGSAQILKAFLSRK